FSGRVLHPRNSYSKGRRIVLCHATEKSRLGVACATDHALETSCPHTEKAVHGDDFGQLAITIEAEPDCPIQLTKYMVYHTSQTASTEELCGRAEWTMDRIKGQGFQQVLTAQEQYMDDFWHRSDVRIRDVREDRTNRTASASDPLQPLSHPAGLGACGRCGPAGERPHRKGVRGALFLGHRNLCAAVS